jgi:serine protease inhibitor
VYSGKTRDFFGMLYKGGNVGMVIALPHKEEDKKDSENPQATIADIEAGFSHMFKKGEFDVFVELPKFRLNYKRDDVVSSFRELGITDLFEVFLFSNLLFSYFVVSTFFSFVSLFFHRKNAI